METSGKIMACLGLSLLLAGQHMVIAAEDKPVASDAELSKCVCSRIVLNVCGHNGRTYKNACEAGCKKQIVECVGECPCPQHAEPHSGCDLVECCPPVNTGEKPAYCGKLTCRDCPRRG